MHTARVELAERSYPVHIGHGLLERAGELLRPHLHRPRIIVVSDASLLATPHPATLDRGLRAAGIEHDVLVVPSGEASKSMPRLATLLDDLLGHGIERRTTVVAFGGGVVGDLAGFAAATAMRGLDLVQIPTTLLAQVDSSVGGKTGVNSRHGKNLIGAFHQPKAVLIDTATLATLPRRELRAGYAEIVKHALIKDPEYFDWLESAAADVLAGDPAALGHAIRRSVEIKAAVVGVDEHEVSGERALLNLGHTFAHAYEALAGYDGALLHGEAVSLGLVRALRLSQRLGHCPGQDVERAVRHLEGIGMPTRPGELGLPRWRPEDLLSVMAKDKKVEDARLRFVLVRQIGAAFLASGVPSDAVLGVLAEDA